MVRDPRVLDLQALVPLRFSGIEILQVSCRRNVRLHNAPNPNVTHLYGLTTRQSDWPCSFRLCMQVTTREHPKGT